jgi:5'/3'-nucleotidase SurE
VQIGLHHYFKARGPVDLVVSGPNYGRNTTAVFSLSSGTIGGAMEAAVCGFRAIALSFAFFDRNHDPEIIAAASAHSVRVIDYLAKNWASDAHLYSVNVPLVEKVGEHKTLWTEMLQNKWASGSCFQEIEVPEEEDEGAEEVEMQMRKAEEQAGKKEQGVEAASGNSTPTGNSHMRYTHKHFKWAPRFKDVYQSVEDAEPGNDGWAVKEGFTRYVMLHCGARVTY